jgi:flagellar basal body-associated protein FliL
MNFDNHDKNIRRYKPRWTLWIFIAIIIILILAAISMLMMAMVPGEHSGPVSNLKLILLAKY